MDQTKNEFKRRTRYKGTHPKSFETKYKEHQPDKYVDTVDKIIKKGNTPAGMHRPICVNEILEVLQIKPGEIGLDATLGYGGHTLEMLKCLDNKGHLYAIDADPIELPKTQSRLEKLGFNSSLLTTTLLNFSDIDIVVLESGKLDFVLADLGVSSMQIDNPARGFSYKVEGPLDLRMNPKVGIPASERLQELNKDELKGMLIENADELYATEISNALINQQKKGIVISTTTQLREIITEALNFLPNQIRDEEIKKACQRTFQALRIDINQELDALYIFLEKLPEALKSGGRVAILSFHSGEDRLVKKSFKHYFKAGIYREIAAEIVRPSMEEQSSNSRARSAKLRWAIKA